MIPPIGPDPNFVGPPTGVTPFSVGPAFIDWARLGLAIAFTALLALTILISFAFVAGDHWAHAKELLQIAVPAEVGLLGAAVGFYFGANNP